MKDGPIFQAHEYDRVGISCRLSMSVCYSCISLQTNLSLFSFLCYHPYKFASSNNTKNSHTIYYAYSAPFAQKYAHVTITLSKIEQATFQDAGKCAASAYQCVTA